jgi:hypothetical protein
MLMSIATALVVVGYVCVAFHISLRINTLRRRYLEGAFKMDNDEILCLIYT